MRKICSFDASTTTIGWSVLEFTDDWQLIKHNVGFFKPPKEGHIAERLAATQKFVQDLIEKYSPDEVCIEDILLGFSLGPKCPVCKKAMGGGTTIKTLTSLAILNRTVCLAVFNKLGKLPHLLSVMKIRHAIKEDHFPKKEEVPAIMDKYVPGIQWKLQSKGKNKGKLAVESYDMADAIALVITYMKIQTKPVKVKKEKKVKTK